MVLTRKDLPIICISFYMLLESQVSLQPLAKRLILKSFHESFLSRDAYDGATRRDVIKGRSKLTSQQQFVSVRERARCIASSTVEWSQSPFDRYKARQNIARAPGYLHNSNRAVFFTSVVCPRCLEKPSHFQL